MSYAINEKIEKAKLLIIEDLLSLKEIAKSLGFDDYNYFSRSFKKRSGHPPTRYKSIVKDECLDFFDSYTKNGVLFNL